MTIKLILAMILQRILPLLLSFSALTGAAVPAYRLSPADCVTPETHIADISAPLTLDEMAYFSIEEFDLYTVNKIYGVPYCKQVDDETWAVIFGTKEKYLVVYYGVDGKQLQKAGACDQFIPKVSKSELFNLPEGATFEDVILLDMGFHGSGYWPMGWLNGEEFSDSEYTMHMTTDGYLIRVDYDKDQLVESVSVILD